MQEGLGKRSHISLILGPSLNFSEFGEPAFLRNNIAKKEGEMLKLPQRQPQEEDQLKKDLNPVVLSLVTFFSSERTETQIL